MIAQDYRRGLEFLENVAVELLGWDLARVQRIGAHSIAQAQEEMEANSAHYAYPDERLAALRELEKAVQAVITTLESEAGQLCLQLEEGRGNE